MEIELLEEIGLSKGEIKVYLTLLRLGETTTGNIINKAQISGGKVYIILEKLIQKGLVSYIIKEKTKYFQATNPNKIVDYVSEREKQLEKKRKKIEEQLPSLKALINSNSIKYDSQIYTGYEGIKTAAFESLKNVNKNEEILIMGISLSRNEKYNILWENWHNQRIKKKINCKMLFSNTNSEFFKYFKKMKNTEIRFLTGITPSSIGIVGERILISTYEEEPSCLVITHPNIRSSFKTFFETLWKIAK